jgi:HEAT repeat protein
MIGEIQVAAPNLNSLAQPFYYRRQAALEVLIATLVDHDRELRVAAAEALGRVGQTAAIRPLLRTLQDEEAEVRIAAAKSLELLYGKPTPETNLILRSDLFPS